MKGEMWMRARRLVAATAISAAAFIATTHSASALNFGPGSPSAVFDGDVVFVLADLRTSPGVGPLPTTVVGGSYRNLVPGFSQTYSLVAPAAASPVRRWSRSACRIRSDGSDDLGGGSFFDFSRANIMFSTSVVNPARCSTPSGIRTA
jgi:hypothetical protein